MPTESQEWYNLCQNFYLQLDPKFLQSCSEAFGSHTMGETGEFLLHFIEMSVNGLLAIFELYDKFLQQKRGISFNNNNHEETFESPSVSRSQSFNMLPPDRQKTAEFMKTITLLQEKFAVFGHQDDHELVPTESIHQTADKSQVNLSVHGTGTMTLSNTCEINTNSKTTTKGNHKLNETQQPTVKFNTNNAADSTIESSSTNLPLKRDATLHRMNSDFTSDLLSMSRQQTLEHKNKIPYSPPVSKRIRNEPLSLTSALLQKKNQKFGSISILPNNSTNDETAHTVDLQSPNVSKNRKAVTKTKNTLKNYNHQFTILKLESLVDDMHISQDSYETAENTKSEILTILDKFPEMWLNYVKLGVTSDIFDALSAALEKTFDKHEKFHMPKQQRRKSISRISPQIAQEIANKNNKAPENSAKSPPTVKHRQLKRENLFTLSARGGLRIFFEITRCLMLKEELEDAKTNANTVNDHMQLLIENQDLVNKFIKFWEQYIESLSTEDSQLFSFRVYSWMVTYLQIHYIDTQFVPISEMMQDRSKRHQSVSPLGTFDVQYVMASLREHHAAKDNKDYKDHKDHHKHSVISNNKHPSIIVDNNSSRSKNNSTLPAIRSPLVSPANNIVTGDLFENSDDLKNTTNTHDQLNELNLSPRGTRQLSDHTKSQQFLQPPLQLQPKTKTTSNNLLSPPDSHAHTHGHNKRRSSAVTPSHAHTTHGSSDGSGIYHETDSSILDKFHFNPSFAYSFCVGIISWLTYLISFLKINEHKRLLIHLNSTKRLYQRMNIDMSILQALPNAFVRACQNSKRFYRFKRYMQPTYALELHLKNLQKKHKIARKAKFTQIQRNYSTSVQSDAIKPSFQSSKTIESNPDMSKSNPNTARPSISHHTSIAFVGPTDVAPRQVSKSLYHEQTVHRTATAGNSEQLSLREINMSSNTSMHPVLVRQATRKRRQSIGNSSRIKKGFRKISAWQTPKKKGKRKKTKCILSQEHPRFDMNDSSSDDDEASKRSHTEKSKNTVLEDLESIGKHHDMPSDASSLMLSEYASDLYSDDELIPSSCNNDSINSCGDSQNTEAHTLEKIGFRKCVIDWELEQAIELVLSLFVDIIAPEQTQQAGSSYSKIDSCDRRPSVSIQSSQTVTPGVDVKDKKLFHRYLKKTMGKYGDETMMFLSSPSSLSQKSGMNINGTLSLFFWKVCKKF